MRRFEVFITVVLLLLSSLPVVSSFFFLVSSGLIEYRKWQNFEKGYSKTYSFALSEVEWINPGKEIRVQGRLMDLQSFQIQQGRIEVNGIWDEDETLLYERFSQMQESPTNETGCLPELLITFLFTPGFPVQPHWRLEQVLMPEIRFSPATSAAACSGYISTLLRPPRHHQPC